jgi:hypothetical protein
MIGTVNQGARGPLEIGKATYSAGYHDRGDRIDIGFIVERAVSIKLGDASLDGRAITIETARSEKMGSVDRYSHNLTAIWKGGPA